MFRCRVLILSSLLTLLLSPPLLAGFIHAHAITGRESIERNYTLYKEGEGFGFPYVQGETSAVSTFNSPGDGTYALASAGISSRNTVELKVFSRYTGDSDSYGRARWTDEFTPDTPGQAVRFRFRVEVEFGASAASPLGGSLVDQIGGGIANLAIGGHTAANEVSFQVSRSETLLRVPTAPGAEWTSIELIEVGATTGKFIGMMESRRNQFSPTGVIPVDFFVGANAYFHATGIPGTAFADAMHTVTLEAVVDEAGNPVQGTFASGIVTESQANAVPEPSSLALLGIGSLTLFGYAWRRRLFTS